MVAVNAVFFGAVFLFSGPLPLEDVSAAPEYRPIIGKRFATNQDLLAIGVTLDRNYKKRVDLVTLVRHPGFTGPEVVTRKELPKGSTFRIVGILQAKAFFGLFKDVRYQVHVPGKDLGKL